MRSFTTDAPCRPTFARMTLEDMLQRQDSTQLPYEALLDYYSREGGLITGDHLAVLIGDAIDQPISTVARWIVERRIVCLSNGVQMLLPLFQFDLVRVVIRPEVEATVGALRPSMSDWGIASWFASPNVFLDDVPPAQAVRRSYPFIVDAARVASTRHLN